MRKQVHDQVNGCRLQRAIENSLLIQTTGLVYGLDDPVVPGRAGIRTVYVMCPESGPHRFNSSPHLASQRLRPRETLFAKMSPRRHPPEGLRPQTAPRPLASASRNDSPSSLCKATSDPISDPPLPRHCSTATERFAPPASPERSLASPTGTTAKGSFPSPRRRHSSALGEVGLGGHDGR